MYIILNVYFEIIITGRKVDIQKNISMYENQANPKINPSIFIHVGVLITQREGW